MPQLMGNEPILGLNMSVGGLLALDQVLLVSGQV
jgi:hypothetical protein